EDVVAAVVKVLAAWNWDQRPAAVISIPSDSRSQLIESLARRIAKIGQMPYLGARAYASKPRGGQEWPARQHNSAQRLRAVLGKLIVPDSVGSELSRLDGPVLLIDDRIETGWTMTGGAKA